MHLPRLVVLVILTKVRTTYVLVDGGNGNLSASRQVGDDLMEFHRVTDYA